VSTVVHYYAFRAKICEFSHFIVITYLTPYFGLETWILSGVTSANANDDNIVDNSRGSIQSKSKTIGFETNTDLESSTRLKPNTSKPLDQLTRTDSNKSRTGSSPARIEPTHDI